MSAPNEPARNPIDDVSDLPDVPAGGLTPIDRVIEEFLDGDMEEIATVNHAGLISRQEVPVSVRIQARGLREPQVSVDTDENRTHFNVGCAHNREFWLEVTITTDTLIELLERAAAQHPMNAAPLLSVLHSAKRLFKM